MASDQFLLHIRMQLNGRHAVSFLQHFHRLCALIVVVLVRLVAIKMRFTANIQLQNYFQHFRFFFAFCRAVFGKIQPHKFVIAKMVGRNSQNEKTVGR